MSDSLKLTDIESLESCERVAKPDELLDEAVDPVPPVAPPAALDPVDEELLLEVDALEELPAPTESPTAPLSDTIVPATGARSSVSSRADCASFTASFALATCAAADAAEVVDDEPPLDPPEAEPPDAPLPEPELEPVPPEAVPPDEPLREAVDPVEPVVLVDPALSELPEPLPE
ncbi:MAG: hypothetical protein AAGC46_16455, partial [Solirubrobacteraceae bacterium]